MAPYGPEAIDYCFKLYLKYNGQQFGRIESEMQKAGWTGWKAQNLRSRGKGKSRKAGWIETYGWEKALKEHLAQKVAPSLDSAQALVKEIETVRKGLAAEIDAKGVAQADKERLQLHRDYCNLSISALTKVEAARDTLSGWVNFFERLIEWGVDIDGKFGRLLIKHSEALIARAEKEFGEELTADGRRSTVDGQDDDSANPEAEAAEPGT
jgi:hypothetical protein